MVWYHTIWYRNVGIVDRETGYNDSWKCEGFENRLLGNCNTLL